MKTFEFPVNYSKDKAKQVEIHQVEGLTFLFWILDGNWQSLAAVALDNKTTFGYPRISFQ